MVSGFLNEYEDLTITIGNETKTCPCSFVEGVEFGQSDSTTVLPYNLTALYYSGETFSEYLELQTHKTLGLMTRGITK